MARVWMTSDTHFNHENSIFYCGRPYWNKDQMDAALIRNWNALVAPDDIVFHLGDVAMHTKPMLRIVPQLNGIKNLVVGNHDLIFPYFTKTRGQKFTDKARQDYIKAGFNIIDHSTSFYWKGKKIRFSHFPTKTTNDAYHNNRHDGFKLEDNGNIVLCGHVHDAWLKRGNCINVGIDVWNMRPVLLDDVMKLRFQGDLDAPKRVRRYVFKLIHKIKRLFREDTPPRSQQRRK